MNNQSDCCTTGDWVLTIFLTNIPLIGFILLIVWAFGQQDCRAKYCKAMLIWQLVVIVLALFLFVIGPLSCGAILSGITSGAVIDKPVVANLVEYLLLIA